MPTMLEGVAVFVVVEAKPPVFAEGTSASSCLNPKRGQLGDDDAYRRWQARMTPFVKLLGVRHRVSL